MEASVNVEHKELAPRGLFPQDVWNPQCACGNDWPCPDAPGRDVVQRPTVDVTGAREALSVGPDEVLVVTFPAEHGEDPDHIDALRRRMLDVIPEGRFLVIFADGVTIAKVKSDPAGRPYRRPRSSLVTCASCGEATRDEDMTIVDGFAICKACADSYSGQRFVSGAGT